ncbi:MAG TPA: DMT family transporter [Gemmatimonadaceae bacterium]|nr:DMT family transporter [Gemmatimonadaceae bacterium]
MSAAPGGTGPGAAGGGAPASVHALGTTFTLLAALGFAAVSTFTSVAVAHGASLPTVLAWRYVLASVVLTVFVGARGYPRLPPRELLQFVTIGGGGQALFVGLALSSIRHITVATLAFLFYTYPAWVTVVQAARGAEPLSRRRAVALALSFAGTVLVAGVPTAPGDDPGYWTGVVMALAAAMIYGVYIPTMLHLQKRHPVAVTSALAKIGTAACFLVWAVGDRSFDYALTAPAWTAIVALAVVSTVLPSVLFLMGLMRLGPVRTAIASTVEPFLTAVIGAVVLAQPLSPRAFAGGAMIVAAVVVLQFRRERVA